MRGARAISALAALVVVPAASVAQPARTEAGLREWLADSIRDCSAPGWKMPVRLEFTLELTSALDPGTVEARWRELERLVDHPERSNLVYHRHLIAAPERMAGTVSLAGPEAWVLEERHEGRHTFRAAGDDDTRWMEFRKGDGGQLTAIRAGVPHPAGYNVSRFYDVTRQRAGLFLCAGLGTLSSYNLGRVTLSGDAWAAAARNGEREAEISGGWLRDGDPVVRELRLQWGDPSAPRGDPAAARAEVYRFEDYAEEGVGWMPGTVDYLRADSVREEYRLVSARPVTGRQVRSMASLPAPEGIRFADFRRPDSGAWEKYRDSPRVTWTLGSQGDSVSVERDGVPLGAGGPGRGSTWLWYLGLLLVVVVVVTVPLLVWRTRRT